MTTGKIIALTICTFVSKVMSLFFNMLSRYVIAFLLYCLLVTEWGIYTALHEKWDPKLKWTKLFECLWLVPIEKGQECATLG